MKRLHKLLFLALPIALCLPFHVEAERCFNWPKIFKENRKTFDSDPKEKHILILPFLNETQDINHQWLSDAIRFGLFLMLENAKDTDVIEQWDSQTAFNTDEAIHLGKVAGADYVIAGQYRLGKGVLRISVKFIDVSGKKKRSLEEKTIEWPSTEKYSEIMIHLARRASKAFKNVRVKKRELSLTEHRVRTIPALQYWVRAQKSDAKGTKHEIEQARRYYEEAIKNDFNYCYAYLGLAQTLTEIGFMNKLENLPYKKFFQEAQKEFTKTLLLCPAIIEKWGKRVMKYFEADALQTSAMEYLRKKDKIKAREKLLQAIELLPGDVSTLEALVQMGETGHKGLLKSVTSCAGSKKREVGGMNFED